MMKGYKYVKKNQIDPVNIIRCKTLTINRFYSNRFTFFDGDQFIAKLPLFGHFDREQFNAFLSLFPRIKH